MSMDGMWAAVPCCMHRHVSNIPGYNSTLCAAFNHMQARWAQYGSQPEYIDPLGEELTTVNV
ncbi:hypothetical protein J6590_049253 [Homalodisca vitripennis]|nr:hypothetical protein J6590_049253 [Homalodisca vitripennis]